MDAVVPRAGGAQPLARRFCHEKKRRFRVCPNNSLRQQRIQVKAPPAFPRREWKNLLESGLREAGSHPLTELVGTGAERLNCQAVEAAQRIVKTGKEYVVDIDLSKFFDRVQHDGLLARVARKVHDKRVLRLIGRYLRAGVMVEGVLQPTE